MFISFAIASSVLNEYKLPQMGGVDIFSLSQVVENQIEECQDLLGPECAQFQDYYLMYNQQDSIIKKIMNNLQSENIAEDVQFNVNKIIEKLPEIFIDNILSKENMYSSSYGTFIIDFEENGNVFSLEVGTNSIGYFSEIDSKTKNFCEEISIDAENFDESILKINTDFLAFYDRLV